MNHISTSRCARFGHPEFRIEFDPNGVLSSDAEEFAAMLERMVADGTRFEDGQSFQVGWSLTRFELEPDGVLAFRESDFQSMPIAWTRGLTGSLRHLRLHKDVVESVLPTESLCIPSFLERCIICTRLAGSERIMMDRQAQGEGDSGWFIGCSDEHHDHNAPETLRPISVFEAVTSLAPMSLGYLGLPAGTSILLSDASAQIYHDSQALSFREGSYLDARFGA